MDSKGVRRLYPLLGPKGRWSTGRKTPALGALPPLIVSLVKGGAGLVATTNCFHILDKII